ncbi:MAG: hypothetical protein Ct9H300mP23_06430 [Nitrospinota bacterium]|nr:MAG: hypothetical protein Ct9H300mP23_06430 [Nitrospinota bacterium]
MKQKVFLKEGKNSDNSGQAIFLSEIFVSRVVVFYAGPVMSGIKCRGPGLSFRKGVTMYDDIYRTSRGSSRLVRE